MTQFITPVEAARLVGDDMTLVSAVMPASGRRTGCSRPFTTVMMKKAIPVM